MRGRPRLRPYGACPALPSEETKDVGRDQVMREFEKVVSSSPDLPEDIRRVFWECLKQPFEAGENSFRKIVGLNPVEG